MPSSSPDTPCGSPSPAGRPPPRPSRILSKSPQIPSQSPPNTSTKKTPAAMPPTKGLAHLNEQQKKSSPRIPSQSRPATTTSSTKTPATTPSTKSVKVQFHIYQLPSNLQGWADGRDLEAPLRHLGLLDVARLQLPTGVPRPHLVSQLIHSYDPNKRCGSVWGSRVNVDRQSFLRVVSLHPTAKRTDLPPDVPWSTVTRAAEQFINMCLRVQWRDMLPAVSAAMQEVKAGSAHTVDWGELMWDLVENEILELPKRDDKTAYFGVYLQRLIWIQRPDELEFDARMKAAIENGIKAGWEKAMNGLFLNGRASLQQPVNKPSNLVERDEASAAVVQVQQQTMEVQRPHLGGITPNNDAGVYKSGNESISPVNDGNMHFDGYNDHMESQKRFQQGNQQKRPRVDKSCGVPAGSAIAIAIGSHDIVEIEWELKHATSQELHEAETFTQVVKLLQQKLSPETVMHMFE